MKEDIDIAYIIKLILLKTKKYWLLISLICVIFCVAGLYIKSNRKNTYQTSALIYLNGITANTTTNELINELNNSSDSILFQELNIDMSIIEDIEEIKSEIIENDAKIIRVTLVINSNENIDIIGNSLLNYLNNNQLLQKLNQRNIIRHEKSITSIQNELERIDSIWKNIGEIEIETGELIDINEKLEDKKNYYQLIVDSQNEPFAFLKPFANDGQLISRIKTINVLIISIFLGVITSFVIIILIDLKKIIS